MPKISQLPPQSSPTIADKVPIVSGGITDYALLSDLIALFFNNIPAGPHSDVTRGSVTIFDHVARGCVWAGDSYGSTRVASMTPGSDSVNIVFINGRYIILSNVTSRTFTASRDTYIDVLDNLDGTGTIVYTEVTNNAVSPALAANSIRIGIIITGATTIANAGSVNQGQETKLLPITSSTPYAVTDSLGNLICSRDPNHRSLGQRQITTSATGTVLADIGGLVMPIIVPNGRRIKLKSFSATLQSSSAASITHDIYEGATQIAESDSAVSAGGLGFANPEIPFTPTAGSHTYKTKAGASAGNFTFYAGSTLVAFISAELV